MAGNANSDDEFHDALTGETTCEKEATKSQMNEKDIDEIVEKQSTLQLDDDEEGAATAVTGASGGDGDQEAKQPDGELSLEELRDLEKLLSVDDLAANKEKADKLKLEGNELFKNDNAQRAIEIYTEGLNVCPSDSSKERAVLYGNRAAAKIKLEANKSAIDDCTKAIELWPEYVRVLLRRAKLYEQDDRPDEALEDYKKVCELDPGQPEAREAQIRLPPIINERNEKLKTEMMANLKDLGNMILKPFGLSTQNFQMNQDPNTGSYSFNFNQNPS
ncbi:tetratricopeptide repeat protein 1 [Drosophila guanche]|uniref:Tetratricopeptide repeat protein 1 n=1 Tax=Drosophila guanche TaxID=7266 RepID=A0A3B0KE30_DROGU|nr:tetratricopeptide repeat protein 1 [Drosophila guanche]SPP84539.1 blast:Tetratricopeptide repeat protein 1 [Drosophila guanche]